VNTNAPVPLKIGTFALALLTRLHVTVEFTFLATGLPAENRNAAVPAHEAFLTQALPSHTNSLGVAIVGAALEIALRTREACVTAHYVATVWSPIAPDAHALSIEAKSIAQAVFWTAS